jgi:hypothetical protein
VILSKSRAPIYNIKEQVFSFLDDNNSLTSVKLSLSTKNMKKLVSIVVCNFSEHKMNHMHQDEMTETNPQGCKRSGIYHSSFVKKCAKKGKKNEF